MLDAVLIAANEIDVGMQNVFEFPRAILRRFKLPAPSCIHLLSPVYVLQHTSVAQNYAPLLTSLMLKKRLDKYLEPIFVLSSGKLDKVDTDDAFDMARGLKRTF